MLIPSKSEESQEFKEFNGRAKNSARPSQRFSIGLFRAGFEPFRGVVIFAPLR
jgi:hypothetical protein